MAKSYEELEFTDNFMFMKVLNSHPDICRELVELILKVKVRSIKIIGYEKTIEAGYGSKGVRFDVYAEDSERSLYDIEMQAVPDKDDLAKRSRYYHSLMDMEQLQKGQPYSELRKSFVIFICKEKIRDDFDRPVYTFRYQSREDSEVYLEDETWTVYVNAQCNDKYLTAEMREFVSFIRTGKTGGDDGCLADRISRILTEAKMDGRWSAEYIRYKMAELDMAKEERKQRREAETRADEAETRADEAETRADEAETRADEAEARADAEKARADAAESRLAEYEKKYGRLEE